MDSAWRNVIQKQVAGVYESAYYQPVCMDCTQQFASIQLGKRMPIVSLLEAAEIAKRQVGIELSLIVCCTVSSPDDEEDTWAMNAPNTTIEDVVRHIQSTPKK
jgi:hypothetical protein